MAKAVSNSLTILQEYSSWVKKAIQIGHEKGRAEGRKERDIEVAKNSLKAGVSIDGIAQIIGLSVNEIQKLRN